MPITVNSTPKERFLDKASNVTNHRALVQNEAFQRAKDTAMLEYQQELARATARNPNLGTTNGMKAAGVEEFMTTFMNLSEKMELPIKAVHIDNLPEDQQRRQ